MIAPTHGGHTAPAETAALPLLGEIEQPKHPNAFHLTTAVPNSDLPTVLPEQPNPWADLWYFVMDEAPLEFERIVTTHSPARWHCEAHKLMRAKYPAPPTRATPPDLSALLGEAREALEDLLDTGYTGGPQGKRARAALARIDTVLNRPAQEPR